MAFLHLTGLAGLVYFCTIVNDTHSLLSTTTMAAEREIVRIETSVHGSPQKCWAMWSTPADIIKWCTATPEWHTPRAENDLRAGGSFSSRMEAKDGSMGFDFAGVYDEVTPHEYIEYTMGDGRKVSIDFHSHGDHTHIIQEFEAESENPIEMQRAGWQAILNNFKQYVESN